MTEKNLKAISQCLEDNCPSTTIAMFHDNDEKFFLICNGHMSEISRMLFTAMTMKPTDNSRLMQEAMVMGVANALESSSWFRKRVEEGRGKIRNIKKNLDDLKGGA